MEPLLRDGFRRAIASAHAPARRRVLFPCHSRRGYATPTEISSTEIKAAPEITFTSNNEQFSKFGSRPGQDVSSRSSTGGRGDGSGRFGGGRGMTKKPTDPYDSLLKRIRIVPASPSYFTGTPHYTDDLLQLSSLTRRYQTLPVLPGGQAPRVAWRTFSEYKAEANEPIRQSRYNKILGLLKRLNYIHPSLMPDEVQKTMDRYKRDVQPHENQPRPIVVDSNGKARAVGRRKSSNAAVWVVEGEGECMINGRSLTDYFGRLHDRESAVWALKATQRLDKYNVWAIVQGGGTTGQAEAITLGLAKALLAHEPDLKPALRRAGCVTRDMRRVERKKPGKLKARKMPAWVKR